MKTDETLWNKILAWMLCDSIPFQHWKLFMSCLSCLCVSCFPRHHEMLPSFGARADRIMQLLLVPAVGAVTSTAQMFLPGAAPSLCNSWNKPKNSRFLFKRCFKIFQDFSYQQLACTRFFVLDWGSCPSWEYASALATEQWLKGMP